MGADHAEKSLPTWRSRPSHQHIMLLLSMAVDPKERSAFRQRFHNARTRDGDRGFCKFLYQTPIAVIAKDFGCKPFPLCLAAEMFLESRLQSEFLYEFYIMDVVLNRAPLPALMTCNGKGVKSGGGRSSGDNCDAFHPVLLCNPEDVGPGRDYFYRAGILFLPSHWRCRCARLFESVRHELAPLAEGEGGGNGVQLSVVHLQQ